MERDQSEHLYTVFFDERQECWYVTPGSPQRIPLSRASLQHLVSLYNDIHRGSPLTLIRRRAMEELGTERQELRETVRSLYDYIDAETGPQREGSRHPGWLTRIGSALRRLLLRDLRSTKSEDHPYR